MKLLGVKFILFFLVSLASARLDANNDTLYLSLDDAIGRARKQSLESIEAKLDRNTGFLNLLNYSLQLLPTFSTTINYEKQETQTSIPLNSNYIKTFTANQIIFSPEVFGNLYNGKLYYEYYYAQAYEKEAHLIYNVKLVYFNLIKAYNLYKVAQAALKRAQENYRLIKTKRDLGEASDFEVLQSETFLSQTELDILSAQKNLATHENELKLLTGITSNVIIRPQENFELPTLDLKFNELWNLIVKYNYSLTSNKKFEKLTKVSFIQSVLNLLPTISYYWIGNYYDTSLTGVMLNWRNQNFRSYGIKFQFPISDLKTYILSVANKKTEHRRAKLQLIKLKQILYKSLLTAVENYQESKVRAEYAQKNLELNQKLMNLAKEQYRLGLISQLDLINTEINFTRAQFDYYNTLYDMHINYAQIEYLVGHLIKPQEQ
ncbi:MAG: TolC family protein [candidate division WOR-3 bacterium]|nr:TolC family protein [candidate division WOR-3 bacterium]MCX7757283.1 TolC family protein [candidate division WOR-3 bacterium]MDW7988108.1 TolC family protein [candidate division WOR-3 bacterium]